MIYQREKPRERLEIGFPKFVEVFKSDPNLFMRDVLAKFGGTFQTIITPADRVESRINRIPLRPAPR
jgi:hypothetical protein